MDKIKGKLSTGFEFEIDKENLNDYELLEYISEIGENPMLLPKVVKKVLGEKQKNELLDHLRNENGIVKNEAIEAAITEIFQSTNEVKK